MNCTYAKRPHVRGLVWNVSRATLKGSSGSETLAVVSWNRGMSNSGLRVLTARDGRVLVEQDDGFYLDSDTGERQELVALHYV